MADNNLDPEEIRKLNEAFKDLTDAMSSHISAMRSSTNSTGSFTSGLKTSMKSVQAGSDVMKKAGDDFRSQMKQNGMVYDRTSKAWITAQEKEMNMLSQSQRAKYEELKATRTKILQDVERNKIFQNELRSLGMAIDSQGKLSDISVKLTAAQKEVLAKANTQKERLEAINKLYAIKNNKLGTMLKAYDGLSKVLGDTLLKLEGGLEKYGSVLKNAGSKVQDFAGQFGPWGKVIGFALGNLIKLAGVSLEFSANLVKSQDELAKFGGNIGLTTDEFYELGRRVGYSSENLNKFAERMAKSGPALAILGGGSVADGLKKFASLGQLTEDQREQYRRLGLNQEALVDSQASYIDLQSMYGLKMNKSVGVLQKESLEYAENLQALSVLTGQDVETLKQRQLEAANDLKWQVKIRQMSESTDEKVRKQADQMRLHELQVRESLGVDAAKAYRDVSVNGFATAKETWNLIRGTGGAFQNTVKQMNSGQVSVTDGIKTTRKQIEKTQNVLGAAAFLGDNLTDFGTTLDGEQKRQIAMGLKTREQVLKEIADKKKAGDAALDTAGRTENAEIRARQAMDSLALTIQKQVLTAMKTFATVMKALAKGIAKFATWLGAPDFEYLFDSAEETKARIEETSSKIAANEKKISGATDALSKMDQAKAIKDPNKREAAIKQVQQESVAMFEADAAAKLKASREKQKEVADAQTKLSDAKRAGTAPELIAKLQDQYDSLSKQSSAMFDEANKADLFAKQMRSEVNNGQSSLRGEAGEKAFRQRLEGIRDTTEKLNKSLKESNDLLKQQYLARDTQIAQDDKRLKQFDDEIAAQRTYLKAEQEKEIALAGFKRREDLDEKAEDTAEERERKKRLKATLTAMEADTANIVKSLEDRKQKVKEELDTEEEKTRANYRTQLPGTNTATGKTAPGGSSITEIKKESGVEKRIGGSVAWRNNNPGNLRYTGLTRSYGAIGEANGFAVFPDKETGDKARERLLFESNVYKGMTLSQMINKYAPSSENDTQGYLNTLTKALGADGSTSLSSLNPEQRKKLLDAMQKHEGWKEGKIEKASSGGIFKGPEAGYPVILHGHEAVIPMTPGKVEKSIDFTKIITTVAEQAKTATAQPTTNTTERIVVDNGLTVDLVEMISSKLDIAIEKLIESNNIQDKLLKVSRT